MRGTYLKALETQAKWLQWLRIERQVPAYQLTDQFLRIMGAWGIALSEGETYYMGKEFCSLVDDARRTIPEDLEFEESWIPSKSGFLFLETPFRVPHLFGLPIDLDVIRAVSWIPNGDGTMFMFAIEGKTGSWTQDGFSAWSYVTVQQGQPVLARIRNFEEHSTTINENEPPYVAGKNTDEFHEIRWLYTALHLMSQKLTVITKEKTSSLVRSMAQRKGRSLNHELSVVCLRRLEYDRQQAQHGEHSNREFNWQWVVTGHWRRQPYREGVYKTIFIEAYVKGPENKPLKPAQHKVFVARR